MNSDALQADASLQPVKEQKAAGVMQRRMLPTTPAQFAGYTLNYEHFGASNLSGDFVDYLALPDNRVAFIVADVAGHGASAALVTVALKSFFVRIAAQPQHSPGALLRRLNSELLAIDLDRHVCAVLGVIELETNKVSLASAGAFPLPFLSRADAVDGSSATAVNIGGKALGLFDAPDYKTQKLSVSVGDRLTVVTDGLLELLGTENLADKERLLAAAAQNPIDKFWSALKVAPRAGGVDDITWFTLERHT